MNGLLSAHASVVPGADVFEERFYPWYSTGMDSHRLCRMPLWQCVWLVTSRCIRGGSRAGLLGAVSLNLTLCGISLFQGKSTGSIAPKSKNQAQLQKVPWWEPTPSLTSKQSSWHWTGPEFGTSESQGLGG